MCVSVSVLRCLRACVCLSWVCLVCACVCVCSVGLGTCLTTTATTTTTTATIDATAAQPVVLPDTVDVVLGVGIALLLMTNPQLKALSASWARFNYGLELRIFQHQRGS
jgi:hypothetical protein